MIGAVLRKFGLQDRRQQQRRPGERPTERRDAPSRPSKCVNCASEQHATRDCPKPRVEVGKRVCFECSLPGHVAANCLKKAGKTMALTDELDTAAYFGCIECVECEEEFARWPKSKSFKAPAPQERNLGNVMKLTNSFKDLEIIDDQDSTPTKLLTVRQARRITGIRA